MSDQLQLTEGSAEWHRLRQRCQTDLYFLADVVLDYGSKVPLDPAVHGLFCRVVSKTTGIPELDQCPYRKIEMPRGTGKTTLVDVCYSIQRILQDPNISILLCNEREQNAKDFLSEIKHHFDSNDLLRALFPEICPKEKHDETWSSTRITVQRDSGRKEPTVFVIGSGGTVTGMHPDLIIVDDILSREAMENARVGSGQLMQQLNRWLHQLKPLLNYQYQPFPEILFVGCIAKGQRVLMATGEWKAIETIQPGERVWSWDAKQQKWVSQKVTGVFPQGIADVVEVATGHQHERIVSTPNHPLLTASGAGGRGERFHRADWFKKYSPVQLVNEIPGEASGLQEEKCWLMGFLVGDGWVTKYEKQDGSRTTYSICAALGVDEALNQRVEDAMRRFLGEGVYRSKAGYLRLDSTSGWRSMEGLGPEPKVGAKDKRLPSWVWMALPEERRAFLRGLIDADGNSLKGTKDSWRLSSASKGLVEDVKRLAPMCGVVAGKVTERHRSSQPPNSPQPVQSSEYTVSLRFGKEGRPLRKGQTMTNTPAGSAEVYDLAVEGTENFICEGFVVHNTRWWFGDSYEHIEEWLGYGEDKRPYLLRWRLPNGLDQTLTVYRVGDLVCFTRSAIEDGQSMFPAKWTLEDLAKMRMEDPVLFAANYMNKPTDDVTAVFKPGWLQFYDWLNTGQLRMVKGDATTVTVNLEDLDKILYVDPGGFGVAHGGDVARAAMVLVGTDRVSGNHLLLDAFSERDTYLNTIRQIATWCHRYRPRKVKIEQAGQQAAFIELVRRELETQKVFVTLEVVTPKSKVKEQRIYQLEPFFQRGLVYIGRGAKFMEFRTQLEQFPRAARKDLLDALAYAAEDWVKNTRRDSPQERQAKELAAFRERRGMTWRR